MVSLLPVPALQALLQPVVLRSENLGPGQGFAEHTHRWNQFVYATAGTLLVTVAHARYVITPEQAIWIPTGTRHATHALHGAAFRNLYVDDAPDLGLPAVCTSYAVSPLMRALIVELEQAAGRQEDAAYLHTLHAMLRAQLQRLPQLQLHLPWPHSPRLRQMCEALYARPCARCARRYTPAPPTRAACTIGGRRWACPPAPWRGTSRRKRVPPCGSGASSCACCWRWNG
ncbi:Uncharacterised protein [uncultured Comamonas sp.]|nr:Uncharacterised protein [uncultured Comamonas sp.]